MMNGDDGLKIVCINSIDYILNLTEGKTYDGLNISDSANPYHNGVVSEIQIYIMDDLDQYAFYPSELFLPLNKLRDRKLEELGI